MLEAATENNAIESQGATSAAAPAPQAQDQATTKVADSTLELDKYEKFKFQGHEYTPEELNRAMLRHSDYTKKTQEIAAERKFTDNLDADLYRVKQDPDLAAQFKKIYPEKFHKFLDVILDKAESEEESEVKLPKHIMDKLKKLDTLEAKLSKVDEIDQTFREREVEAASQHLDAIFTKFSDKYPYAIEDVVLNRAQHTIDINRDNPKFSMTEAAWERLFKQSHEYCQSKFEPKYKQQIEAQIKKSEAASDSAPGGSAPGRAPRNMTFKEATEMAIEDLKARGAR